MINCRVQNSEELVDKLNENGVTILGCLNSKADFVAFVQA